MLAVTAPGPFSRPGWWFETKWDGYRAIISVGQRYAIYSRRGHDLMRWYPELGRAQDDLPDDIVLDAELVAWSAGRPHFSDLQRRSARQYLLMVFDCLYSQGRWLMHEPLARRLEELHRRVSTRGLVAVSEGVPDNGAAFFSAVRDMELEGVMAKRLDSLYLPGRRSPAWQKFLALKMEWFWATGLMEASDGQWYWLLGEHTEGTRHAVGKVRAPGGWSPPAGIDGNIRWVRPFLVEVAYRERTREGHLRHARVRQWKSGDLGGENPPPGADHIP